MRTAAYKPALAWFAAIGTGWVFVLVTLGAFTTTIGAGMAFPDWPLSNGSLNPAGWLTELDKFAEHSHRISAAVMSAVTVVLAAWLWRTEARAWLRRLAVFAAILVIAQAVVGGLRVLFDRWHIETVDTSVGRLFAMLHACLAQLFVCALIAIAVACTRGWIQGASRTGHGARGMAAIRRAGVVCCVLLFVQLAIAAVMRHSFAWASIPTFPYSNLSGGFIPAAWDFRVAIHFAHRVMALVLSIAIIWFAVRIWFNRSAPLLMRSGASAMVSLVAFQILLGAQIVLSQHSVTPTTGHVLVGAFVLAITFLLTWLAHQDVIETRNSKPETRNSKLEPRNPTPE